MTNLTLLDADPLSFILGYTYRDADYSHMLYQVDSMMNNILSATGADEYLGFLGGEKCFRHEVAVTKPYKGNRKGEQPDWLAHWKKPICEHLVKEWGLLVVDRIEADDAIGICWNAYKNTHLVTIASPDKDLRQFAGMFFDFKKWEHELISERDANYGFWYQMIVGDTADSIPGLPGKGPAFAQKLLNKDYAFGPSFKEEVRRAYEKVFGKDWLRAYEEQYQLLRMLTEPAYGFTVPTPLPVAVLDPFAEKKVYEQPVNASVNTNYLAGLGF